MNKMYFAKFTKFSTVNISQNMSDLKKDLLSTVHNNTHGHIPYSLNDKPPSWALMLTCLIAVMSVAKQLVNNTSNHSLYILHISNS